MDIMKRDGDYYLRCPKCGRWMHIEANVHNCFDFEIDTHDNEYLRLKNELICPHCYADFAVIRHYDLQLNTIHLIDEENGEKIEY